MLESLFREAFCHSPTGHTILGRKLHPFCAFDLLSLEAINSPFIQPGSTCEVADLLLAVWILSNPIAPDLTIGHLELSFAGRAWVDRIRGEIEMPRDCGLMETYIADFHAPPEMMGGKPSTPITALGAPWIFSVVIGVVKQMHLPLREAWTMGLGQLLWYRAALVEMEDPETRIVSDDMRAQLAAAAKPQEVFAMQPGETIDDFAARMNLDPATAAMLLHQGQTRK